MPFIDISGATVECRQTGDGPDLLMLHSLLTELTVFDRILPALSAVNAGCFARACLALARLNLSDALGTICNPSLIMCGTLDQTTPPGLARILAQHVNDAVFHEIPDSGHCPMLEQPQALAALIEAFLVTRR